MNRKTTTNKQVNLTRLDVKNLVIEKNLPMTITEDLVLPAMNYNPDTLNYTLVLPVGYHLSNTRIDLKSGKIDQSLSVLLAGLLGSSTEKLKEGTELHRIVESFKDPKNWLYPFVDIYDQVDLLFKPEDGEFMTAFSQAKRFLKRTIGRVDQEFCEFMMEQLPWSRKKDCPLVWKDGHQMPERFNVSKRLTLCKDRDYYYNYSSTHWLFYLDDGRITMPDFEPTVGATICGDTGELIEIYDKEPYEISDCVVKAIKFTVCVNPVNQQMKGIAWKLFIRNKVQK